MRRIKLDQAEPVERKLEDFQGLINKVCWKYRSITYMDTMYSMDDLIAEGMVVFASICSSKDIDDPGFSTALWNQLTWRMNNIVDYLLYKKRRAEFVSYNDDISTDDKTNWVIKYVELDGELKELVEIIITAPSELLDWCNIAGMINNCPWYRITMGGITRYYTMFLGRKRKDIMSILK